MKVLYIDMDNVLVDFKSGIDLVDAATLLLYEGRYDEIPHIFGKMKPTPGTIEAYHELAGIFDTHILSTSPWENDTALADKLNWVKTYLGSVACKRLILSHHKNLNRGDFIVDDRTKNGVDKFDGEHIHFCSQDFPNWEAVVKFLKTKI